MNSLCFYYLQSAIVHSKQGLTLDVSAEIHFFSVFLLGDVVRENG